MIKDYASVIGARIKQLRKEKGLTQKEMSKKLYITRSCLGNYEAGNRTPDKSMLISLSELFDTDFLMWVESLKQAKTDS